MPNNTLTQDLQREVDAIKNIDSIPSILNVICRTTGMGFSAIARVTDKKWITCAVQDEVNFGLKPGDELILETTICNEIRGHHQPVIIEEVENDAIYCNHPTPLKYGFQSYVSYPIFTTKGEFFGTLCALDNKPASLNNKETHELFLLYTQLISFYLSASKELNDLNTQLDEEKRLGELRETFIAVLGHDLRNPIGTIRMCTDILSKMELPDMAKRQVKTVKSTTYRMQGLIDNLLDFAKGHLGDGIQLDAENNIPLLKKSLNQVAKEIKTVDTLHEIKLYYDFQQELKCDINRISQLYSNLLGNAVKHGDEEKPIYTRASSKDGVFELSVTNSGNKIPEEKQENLFKPFFSTHSQNNKSGLGLGLYISAEIAKAHGGQMYVHSDEEQTVFKFAMPITS